MSEAARSFQTLLVRDDGAVRTITLNRPERRNALTSEMVAELTEAFGSAGESSARVLVLTGAGEAFCAGLDLAELRVLADRTPAEHRAESQAFADLLRTLYELPLPTIAAVNGAAVAGGMGLATVCDFTLAVPAARLGYTEVRIGFLPAIVSAFLTTQAGDKRARDLLLTGRLLHAEEAAHLGLVTRVVPAEELNGAVQELAKTLLANSPSSLRATKALLVANARAWLDAALPRAVEANAELRTTAEFREGLSAFLEKRAPNWAAR